MIRVCYSNRIERLVDALGEALAPPGDLDAMFAGPWLVVPNRPLELYVDLELARRRGISGNIDTMSMPGLFARLCAAALPDVVLIERDHIAGELLAALCDPALDSNADLAPLHAYLRAAGTAPDAIDRRRVDVARALGALFDDWILGRPELCASFADQQPSGKHRWEHAERTLWNTLFGSDGRFARRSDNEKRRYLTLPNVLGERLDDAWRPPPAIHVFGPSVIPRGLQIALGRLGARTELAFYAVNPCRQFWEDLNTRRRAPAQPAARSPKSRPPKKAETRQLELLRLADPTEKPASDRENPLLRLWGHAGREATRLLNELTDGDFEDLFEDRFEDTRGTASGPTLLGRLQRDLLEGQALDATAGHLDPARDDSVVILGAPNPRRELETIAAEIWAMIRADAATPPEAAATTRRRGLRFSDIAVLIAGPDEPYLSLARAVFREANLLPHTIVDQPLSASSHVVEALVALLALPLGRLTRREVLDVITHPNIRARFPEADPGIWLELCDALTIAHGADRADFVGTYVDADVFNWDQGCKRLALGMFARGPHSGIEDPIRLTESAGDAAGTAYLPAEVASDLHPDAGAMALLVRSLLADARYAQTERMPLADWMRFVRALFAAYVVPLTADDETARLRVLATLDRIAALAPPDLRVGLGVAHQLTREALTGLRGSRGQILGAGVTVGTLSALRGLPFRAIFVAGLGPDRFPAVDRPSPLDLDADRRRPGDVTARQQDRYLLVETLLAAREKLVLSYLDRDALTGDAREPSPVVLEFLDELSRVTLRPPQTRSVPLHRDEDPGIRAAFPGAAAEAQAREIGESLRAHLPDVARLDASEIVRGLSPDARRTLGPLLRIVTPPASSPPDPRTQRSQTRVLQLSDLRRFLECPLQGSARVFMGLRDLPDETDARELADEPFDIPRYLERSLLGDVFAAAWNVSDIPAASSLALCYDAALARQRAGRLLPAGLFRASVRRRHLLILGQWAEALAAIGPPPRGPIGRVCFGRPQPFAPPADLRDPIRLNVKGNERGDDPYTVEIHGTTEPQLAFGAESGSLVLAASYEKEKNEKDSLRAFIDYVALSASAPEQDQSAGFSGAICRPAKDGNPSPPWQVSFAPLGRERARAYLTDLASELLGSVHAYLFPCEAVFYAQRKDDLTLAERIKQIQTDLFLRDHCSSRWGPVPEPFEYPIPEPDDAYRLKERRFGLFFAMRPESPARELRSRT